MKCSKCGTKNDDNFKFCSNCGNKIEVKDEIVNTVVINEEKTINETKKKKIPVLSWLAFYFLMAKILVTIISGVITYNMYSNYESMLDYDSLSYNGLTGLAFLRLIPFLTASLVLSIISRVKNKDTMSLVIMIIDIILIVLIIVAAILLMIFVGAAIIACGDIVGQMH